MLINTKNKLKTILVAMTALFICQGIAAQDSVTVSAKDLLPMTGNWTGRLTYLDYSSGKEQSIAAKLGIQRVGDSDDFIFSFSYPDEPKANSSDTVSVHYYGTMVDEEVVQLKTRPCSDCLTLITEQFALDGNEQKPALIRRSYLATKTSLNIRKEVKYLDGAEWIQRNEYRLERE